MARQILLVDDDIDFREEFVRCFSEYDIVEASYGDEALGVLSKPNDIGLVILDVKMPGSPGTDILARIKQLSPKLHTIILTGYSSESVAIDALKSRADDYIEKPFDIEVMKETIEKHLTDSAKRNNIEDDSLDDRIRRAKDFVKRNCYKKVTLKDAAQAVSLCPKYFSRMFKAQSGQGFCDYRLGLQMAEARKLLSEKVLSVGQVSDKLGYKNVESFVRQFKKHFGRTPGSYKKR